MTVDDFDLLANEDLPENRNHLEEYIWNGCLRIQNSGGQMVHFESIGEVPNTSSLPTVGARNHDDFVASVYQALSQVVHVHFDTTKVRHEEVRDHGDS